ncbi:MAG: dodecin family protein [Arenimonas sp.]
MSNTVAKVIEISSSSTKNIEDAVQGGLKKVSRSVKNIKGAWVNDIKVVTDNDGQITEWRVDMKVTFIVGKE